MYALSSFEWLFLGFSWIRPFIHTYKQHACIYTFIHTYTYIHTVMRTCNACMHAYIHTYIHTYTHTYCNACGCQQLLLDGFNHLTLDVEVILMHSHTLYSITWVSYVSCITSLVLRFRTRHITVILVLQLASVHLNTTVIPLSTCTLARAMTTPISLHFPLPIKEMRPRIRGSF